MKKIYISGCGGMLGEAFYLQFKNGYELKCTDIDVNEEWLSYCDIRERERYYADVFTFSPDYLFHLGALTDLEYCELHQDNTFTTNALAVENATYITNKLEIPLLYVSTAGIFDGKKDTYDDWDVPNPLGAYARAKYAGEVFVRENARSYFICRAGWMMGGGYRKDKKFIRKILTQINDGSKKLYIVNDKMGTLTYTHDFASNVCLLLESELWGVYNMVCTGETNRLEIAKEILKILGREDIEIVEVSSEYFRKEYFVPRANSEILINRKLHLRGLNIMRDWKVALREYLGSMKGE